MGTRGPAIRILPVAALLLVAAALWVWADRMLPRAIAPSLQILASEDCDLNAGACTVALQSGGAIEIEIVPVPIVGLRPLVFEIRLSHRDPEWIELDLAGVEMFMGHNRSYLERVGPGAYRGEVTLPVCASERMTWAATVLPEGRTDLAEFQFRFVSRR
jgi:hypothetical protein